MTNTRRILVSVATALASALAIAQTPAQMLQEFERDARQADPAFQGFSASRGEKFFRTPHGGEWSCASCHTDRPAQPGRHARTGKTIAPLAPAANPRRFADPAKAEKWFKRNCNDVLSRPCTPAEKGDVLTWLSGLRK